MTLKKDKAKVLDEVWTEARIRGFLEVIPAAGVDPDFHTLLKAYQQMRADDFKTFISMFQNAGRRVDARNSKDETLLDIVSAHSNSTEFVDILREAEAGN